VKIETARFGIIEVSEEEVFTFPKGIPGLADFKKFIILPASNEEKSPFFFLQSVENKELSLFLLDPFQSFKDYHVDLDQKTIETLEVENDEDVMLLTVVTVNKTLSDSTANLKAPIVFNVKKKLAVQMIIENNNYQIKQPLSV
jgi:flagellar assembly factor FliW